MVLHVFVKGHDSSSKGPCPAHFLLRQRRHAQNHAKPFANQVGTPTYARPFPMDTCSLSLLPNMLPIPTKRIHQVVQFYRQNTVSYVDCYKYNNKSCIQETLKLLTFATIAPIKKIFNKLLSCVTCHLSPVTYHL